MTAAASLEFAGISYSPEQFAGAIATTKAELRRAGVDATSVVVLRARLSDRYVVALLALDAIGCCLVPIDADTPGPVADRIIAATAPTAIVDDDAIITVAPETADSVRAALNPLHVGYVLFTSGSTGEPKGVLGSRRGLARRVRWGTRYFASPDVIRWGIRTSPAFIDSLTEILVAFRSGATLVVAPPGARSDLGQLCDFVAATGIEQLTMTPSGIPVLAAVGGDRLAGLRRWIFSGEELRSDWVARARRLAPGAQIINSYGATEVCGDATFAVLRAGDAVPPVIGIGCEAPGVRIRVDTSAGPDDLPAGVGELWVGGEQVALGYLGAATGADAGRFRMDADGTRWFRTGDLVRPVDDNLIFLGRRDRVAKVRGRRVDLAGVAAALERLDGVAQAHAWVDSDPEGAALRAAVVADPGVALTVPALRAALAQQTLPQLIPDWIDVLGEFPRTVTGKLDRRRVEGTGRGAAGVDRSRFVSGLEYIIACTIAEATGGAQLDRSTPYGDLGLDSLRAVRVADRLSVLLGCDLTALQVLSAGTVRELAEQIPSWQLARPRTAARPVRDGAADRTLLLLHPAIGTCLGYFTLLRQLVYPGRIAFIEQDESARDTLDQHGMAGLAELYAQRGEQLCGGGRIDVVGYSFGALIAPAVASALLRRHAEVGSVVLIDPAPVRADVDYSEDWALRRVLLDAGYREHLPDDELDLRTVERLIATADGPLRQVPVEQIRHWVRRLRSNAAAAAGYEPAAAEAATLVVQAASTGAASGDDAGPTGYLVSAETVVRLDCTHFELLNGAPVRDVAAAISRFLAERATDER